MPTKEKWKKMSEKIVTGWHGIKSLRWVICKDDETEENPKKKSRICYFSGVECKIFQLVIQGLLLSINR